LASITDEVLVTHLRAITLFEDYLESDLENMPIDEWVSFTNSTAEGLHADAAELQSLAEDASSGLAERVAELGAGIEDLAASLDALVAAEDDAAVSAANDQMSAAVDRLAAAEIAYDDYLAEHPAASGDTMWFVWTGLVILAALCLVVAVILWVRSGKLARQFPPLGKARTNVALAALIFLVGTLIPAVQYWGAEPGEEYTIIWYPLVVGGIWFFVALRGFFSNNSKAKRGVAAAGAEPAPDPSAAYQAALGPNQPIQPGDPY
jgi:hypothetical protein